MVTAVNQRLAEIFKEIGRMDRIPIRRLDLVVVNVYPFEQTIAKSGVTPAEAIENIDIGGPSLVRAAAKNHPFTAVATQPDQYAAIIEELRSSGGTSLALRQKLAAA